MNSVLGLPLDAFLAAAVAARVVAVRFAQISHGGGGDLSAVKRSAPRTTAWPTNGGNL